MEDIKYAEGSLVGKVYKAGITFGFTLAIPTAEVAEYGLLIEHDGLNQANVDAMNRLAKEGCAPYCVCVGVCPGVLHFADGEARNMRMNSYDLFDSEYGDFLVHELIPYVEETFGIQFSKDPDLHYVSGGSSGGISAFAAAWFHPDYFHRVYMSSPSFLAMGRGNEIPYLIRKCETKPLRIYEEFSENEPNDYFGASYPIDVEMKMALEFAGYDFAWAYFPGEWHCSRYRDEEAAYNRNKWIWQDYTTKKIMPPRNSPRLQRILPADDEWEAVETFPEKEIISFRGYSCAVKSADGKLYYAVHRDEDIVYARVAEGQEGESPFVQAMLHTLPRVEPKGVIDMAVDSTDRLYVLTAMGIQCVRGFGLIDGILDLPQGEPLEIAVADGLYVKTHLGTFRRALQPECLHSKERKCVSYYD